MVNLSIKKLEHLKTTVLMVANAATLALVSSIFWIKSVRKRIKTGISGKRVLFKLSINIPFRLNATPKEIISMKKGICKFINWYPSNKHNDFCDSKHFYW